MEPFYNLMCIFNVAGLINARAKKDIIGHLPPEVACIILRYVFVIYYISTLIIPYTQWDISRFMSIIFRKLDVESLINCMKVDNYWRELCKSDPLLRSKILSYIKSNKRYSSRKENMPVRIRGLNKIANYLNCFSAPRPNQGNYQFISNLTY
jgi:hypothetical protein